MPKTNNSYYAILGVLGSGPMSGYGIKVCLNEGVGCFWDINYKQIYPTLKRLVDEGLATYHIKDDASMPRSKVYTLTSKGFEVLKDWLDKPIIQCKMSANELRLKLFFGHLSTIEKSIEHVQDFKKSVLKDIKIMEKIRDRLVNNNFADMSHHYRMVTITNGLTMAKSSLDWCNQTIEYLSDIQAKGILSFQ